jgi:preprotein translocase subunit SecE
MLEQLVIVMTAMMMMMISVVDVLMRAGDKQRLLEPI